MSVAGVARRHVRRGAYVGAGLAGATAVGIAAAVGAAYGYDSGPYGAYAAMPYRAYGYGYYRLDCAPGPRVGAFATQPWDDVPTCSPY